MGKTGVRNRKYWESRPAVTGMGVNYAQTSVVSSHSLSRRIWTTQLESVGWEAKESLLEVSKSPGRERLARAISIPLRRKQQTPELCSGARKWRQRSWARGNSWASETHLLKKSLMTSSSPRRSCQVCEYQDFYKVTLIATPGKVSKFSWSLCAHPMPQFRKGFCPRLELCCDKRKWVGYIVILF